MDFNEENDEESFSSFNTSLSASALSFFIPTKENTSKFPISLPGMSTSVLPASTLPLVTNVTKTLLAVESMLQNVSYLNSTYTNSTGTYYDNGTWFGWLPEFNKTGNRGGGVAHQNSDPSAISTDDAAWVLTATFIIFTMQSGEFSLY